jgi:hypothetical protein
VQKIESREPRITLRNVHLAPEIAALNKILAQRPAGFTTGCPLCGCTGVHACTGRPIVWTEEDKARLHDALADMFGWKKPTTPEEIAAVNAADARAEEAARTTPSCS